MHPNYPTPSPPQRHPTNSTNTPSLPDKGPYRPSIQRRSKHLRAIANIELLQRVANIRHNQHSLTIRRLEGNVRQRIKTVGVNPNRSRPHKLRRMSNRVVSNIASHRIAVDR